MNRRSLCARIVAFGVAMIVAVWSTALCAAGMVSRHAPHACCVKKAQGGPAAVAPATCCAENSDNYFVAFSAPAPVPAPAEAVITLLAAGAVSDGPLDRVVAAHATPLKLSKTPTYLAVSNFRL
jgi:hypothetical protein